MLTHVNATVHNTSIDLTFSKKEVPLTPPEIKPMTVTQCEQSTQTDFDNDDEAATEPVSMPLEVKVKIEPKNYIPIVKQEDSDSIGSEHLEGIDPASDNSEDNMSLGSLKKKKKSRKGEGQKRGRKKKATVNDWQLLINSLPESTAVKLVDKQDVPSVTLDVMKEEMDLFGEGGEGEVQVKKEPADDTFQCCICFTQTFSRTDMLAHYKYVLDFTILVVLAQLNQ